MWAELSAAALCPDYAGLGARLAGDTLSVALQLGVHLALLRGSLPLLPEPSRKQARFLLQVPSQSWQAKSRPWTQASQGPVQA